MKNEFLNIAAVRFCTEAEGPGKRFAIWLQGCLKRCPGCCNPQMQEIKPLNVIMVEDLICLIEKAVQEYNIEGISLIGGEPLLQVRGISYLAAWCKKHKLTVLLFTGFLYQDLLSSDDCYIRKLLNNLDILVDGLYDEKQPDDERDWVGSKNQQVIFLSDSYPAGIEYQNKERQIEIQITESSILINGWPFV